MKKLISEEVYSTAYPVHDESKRNHLLSEWARYCTCKNQPIDTIKEYFGVKMALYFAWLGFYTNMLIAVAIFGIVCIVVGALTLPQDTLSVDMCDPRLNITMCPQCDLECDYWKLDDACIYSEMSHVIDNYCTIAFSIVMSVWSSIYVNYWKRNHFHLMHRWGLTELQPEDQCPRPEFLAKLKTMKGELPTKKNKITNKDECVVPKRYKYPHRIFSAFFALLSVNILLDLNI